MNNGGNAMSTYRKLILGLMMTSALALVLPFQAQAAAQQAPWVYAAKFICGTKTADGDVVKGQYATTVNILNLWANVVVPIEKQAVIAKPERQSPGPISGIAVHQLAPYQAMAVDCTDIRGLFTPQPTGYIEGFLMIRPGPNGISLTDPPLEVVAKYTARHRGTNSADPGMYDVETLDVEKILPKVWLPTQ